MANNTTDECFDIFSEPQYVALLAIRIILSLLSVCILLCVIGLIALFKKYIFMCQRLVLYLALSSCLFSLSQAFNFDSHTSMRSKASLEYCVVMGFVTQVAVWWEILASTCIMIDIVLKALFQVNTEKLEKFYVIFIFITPPVFSWVPFVHEYYGPAGLYCWIRNQNLHDCSSSEFGNWLRFSMYYIPFYVIMVVLITLVVFSLIFTRWRKKKWVGKYSPETQLIYEMIEKEIKQLVWYPFIFVVINIVPLVRRVYSAYDDYDDTFFYVLTAVQIVIYRFQGVLIGLVFALDPETRQKLKWTEIKARCCSRKSTVQAYPARTGLSDSNNPYSKLVSDTKSKYCLNDP